MGFGFHHTAWLDEWSKKSNEEWARSFGQVRPPDRLYHYTRSLEKIIQSGCLWSVALNAQADSAELSHGVEMLRTEIESAVSQDRNSFMENILRLVPNMVEGRKGKTFVTCFCAEPNSPYHFDKYGKDRLEFPVSGRESLDLMRTPAHEADIQLFKVIYDLDKQAESLRKLLSLLKEIAPKYLVGDYQFLSEKRVGIEEVISRAIGQLFLDFLIGFKQECWTDDQEWRLLCRPVLKLGSTAPRMADEAFNVAIRGRCADRGDLRRVELRLPNKNMKSGLPLSAVHHFGHEKDINDIQKLLSSRWYENIPVTVSVDEEAV